RRAQRALQIRPQPVVAIEISHASQTQRRVGAFFDVLEIGEGVMLYGIKFADRARAGRKDILLSVRAIRTEVREHAVGIIHAEDSGHAGITRRYARQALLVGL